MATVLLGRCVAASFALHLYLYGHQFFSISSNLLATHKVDEGAGTYTKKVDFWTSGHYSKFVKPGWNFMMTMIDYHEYGESDADPF